MDVGDMYTDYKTQCILQVLLFKELVMKFIDRTGHVFGKLTVLEQAGRDKLKKVLWRCKCECGSETVVVSGSLVTGNTASCGCIVPNFKHGGWNKSSYNTWRAMMRRCYNPIDKDYPRWGGRGVTVCTPWHDYATFAKDVGEPSGAETFDRIDTTGDYKPSNVRWATPTVQARNIRVPKTSKTGITGVLFHGGYFYAAITAQKKKYYSKVCKSLEEAAAARKELERLHWGIA
jgi:hypothetical protein